MKRAWIEVHDGGDENAPLIGNRLYGNGDELPNLISTGNELFLRFHSDSDTNKTGYRILADLGKTLFCLCEYDGNLTRSFSYQILVR